MPTKKLAEQIDKEKEKVTVKAIAARAISDPEFKEKLLADPKKALSGYRKNLSPETYAAFQKIKAADLRIHLSDLDRVAWRFTVAATAQWD